MREKLTTAIAVLAIVLVAAPAAGAEEAGIELRIDAGQFRLHAYDRARGESGPELRVTLGSPAHGTPHGRFRPQGVIHQPSWMPTARARAAGILPMPPSNVSPMGIAKIPLSADGSIALHGGGNPLLLGKPASSGCIRLSDAGMQELLDWLAERDVLGGEEPLEGGSLRQAFRRPVRVQIR